MNYIPELHKIQKNACIATIPIKEQNLLKIKANLKQFFSKNIIHYQKQGKEKYKLRNGDEKRKNY